MNERCSMSKVLGSNPGMVCIYGMAQRMPLRMSVLLKAGALPLTVREENCSAGGGDMNAHFPNPPPSLVAVPEP